MNRMEDSVLSPSYFWDCLKLSEDCPFFSRTDPKLYYFAVGMTILYVSLVLMILCDLRFYWSLDNLCYRVDNCLNFIKKKIQDVQMNQRRLVSTQEKAEKQLKHSKKYNQMVSVLRFNIAKDPDKILLLNRTKSDSKTNCEGESQSDQYHDIDFTDLNAEFDI